MILSARAASSCNITCHLSVPALWPPTFKAILLLLCSLHWQAKGAAHLPLQWLHSRFLPLLYSIIFLLLQDNAHVTTYTLIVGSFVVNLCLDAWSLQTGCSCHCCMHQLYPPPPPPAPGGLLPTHVCAYVRTCPLCHVHACGSCLLHEVLIACGLRAVSTKSQAAGSNRGPSIQGRAPGWRARGGQDADCQSSCRRSRRPLLPGESPASLGALPYSTFLMIFWFSEALFRKRARGSKDSPK